MDRVNASKTTLVCAGMLLTVQIDSQHNIGLAVLFSCDSKFSLSVKRVGIVFTDVKVDVTLLHVYLKVSGR